MIDLPDRDPNPPDEPDVFIECAICEAVENVEDATQIYDAQHICTSCRKDILSAKLTQIHECDFCGDAPDLMLFSEERGRMFICNYCYEAVNK